jgi:phospholipase/carboxylesterase
VVDRITELRARYAPDALVLVGYSQGAMLALDVAVALDPPPERVAAISGYLLIDTARRLESEPAAPRPPVLVVQGRRDQIVELSRAETTVKALEANGFDVDFVVHGGGHPIRPEVVERVRAFARE